MIMVRDQHRQNRDFTAADKIRDTLRSMGVTVDDRKEMWMCTDGRSGPLPVQNGGRVGGSMGSGTMASMGMAAAQSWDGLASGGAGGGGGTWGEYGMQGGNGAAAAAMGVQGMQGMQGMMGGGGQGMGGGMEVQIQIPDDSVGRIIGKGGTAIEQVRSGIVWQGRHGHRTVRAVRPVRVAWVPVPAGGGRVGLRRRFRALLSLAHSSSCVYVCMYVYVCVWRTRAPRPPQS
jgi:hypothetical protein